MLPSELTDDGSLIVSNQLEQRVCRWMLWSSPILFIVGWVVACLLAKNLLFRLPVEPTSQLAKFKLGMIGGIAAVLPGIVWWCGLWIQNKNANGVLRSPILCTLTTITVTVGICVAMTNPKATYALQESIKARAPQLDFVRNIVFQQQSLSRPTTGKQVAKIGLIGSSQVMLGIDADQLAEDTGGETHSCCMPGMVPMQYAAVSQPMANKKLTHVVCWLSEFDFYREKTLPTNRLRWCSSAHNMAQLLDTLDWNLCFKNRGELADLAFAATCPLWQQRSVIQMGAFRFWWRFDNVESSEKTKDADEQKIGGKLVAKEQGVANARKNIQRTPLLLANVASFQQFANAIVASGAKLIVIEGESHPDTMNAYPHEFRSETRQMLMEKSVEIGFEYFESEQRPQFELSDWRDAVHLNERGRAKLTEFVATLINGDKPAK